MKHKCKKCDAPAVWCYDPNPVYYCDEHVPRGCSCMTDVNGDFLLDDKGRKIPCVEYVWNEKGYRAEL